MPQLRAFYRINITDIVYAYEGTYNYLVEDEAIFDAFNVESGKLSDVEVPEQFEDESAEDWLSSVAADADEGQSLLPYILLNEISLWSNC